MEQDLKCFFGNHKFKLIKEEQVCEHSHTDDGTDTKVLAIIGLQLICQCSNCGKVKSWFIPTDSKYINMSVRA